MIKFLFGKMINELVAKEVAKEVAKINQDIDTTDDKIKEHCGKLIKFLFSDEVNDEAYVSYGWGHGGFRKIVKGELKDGIADIVISKLEREQKEKVDEHLKGEEFIDGIVERILKKQIK